MRFLRTKSAMWLAGASAVALAGPAWAQDAGAPADDEERISTVEQITVTARRREETVQDIPAAVSAFTETEIESAGITSARDFIALTPNVTLVETQNAGNAFVVIRGISQARNSEPSVAVIIDGFQQTNPAQFSQELVEIQQIEVLRGPQGALYGRNAIGGAINITTKGPTDSWEARVLAGVDNGPGYTLSARASGPITDTLGFSGGIRWRDTEGYRENEFLNEDADPVENLSGRGRLVWEPDSNWTFDLRGSFDQLDTQALFFVIDPNNDVNNTSIPITVNNPGQNERDIYTAGLQIQYDSDFGTFTSTTTWDSLEEILTGDAFDFRPIEDSFFFGLLGFDLNQSQFLDVENISQEFRFVSPDDRRIRYIAGAYLVSTDRFISTGNLIDTGNGVTPVFRTPSTNPDNPQFTFLADEQNNFAWAVFGDVTADITDRLELSVSLRYDEDEREQTTLTPPEFLDLVNVPGFPPATTGEVRTETFEELQPKVTLRYAAFDNVSVYASYSRGFRSGGFNQTGVGAIAFDTGFLGVNDIFEAEVADTFEAGFKSTWWDGRLTLNGAGYRTVSENGYFFVFLPANSTQNLGNIDEAEFIGFELDGVAQLTDDLSVNFGIGFTDSEITEFADPAAVGNEAPLVSEYTINLGAQYLRPLGGTGLDLRSRVDYQRIGDTYWEPFNVTVRDPVDLVDLRVGVETDTWALTAWSKNLFDTEYNAEFSPGGFLFPALPRRYGAEVSYRF